MRLACPRANEIDKRKTKSTTGKRMSRLPWGQCTGAVIVQEIPHGLRCHFSGRPPDVSVGDKYNTSASINSINGYQADD